MQSGVSLQCREETIRLAQLSTPSQPADVPASTTCPCSPASAPATTLVYRGDVTNAGTICTWRAFRVAHAHAWYTTSSVAGSFGNGNGERTSTGSCWRPWNPAAKSGRYSNYWQVYSGISCDEFDTLDGEVRARVE